MTMVLEFLERHRARNLFRSSHLKLLSVATRLTFRCKYAFLTDSPTSRWLLSSVNRQTTLLK